MTDPLYRAVTLLLPLNGANGATTTTDASSRGNTMTFVGNAIIDNAVLTPWGDTNLKLDGNGDWITTPISAELQWPAIGTVEAWVYLNSGFTGVQTLAGVYGTSGNRQWALSYSSVSGLETWSYGLAPAGATLSTLVSGDCNMTTDAWHHIAFTRAYNNRLFIHLDGVLIGSNNSFTLDLLQDSNAVVMIGNRISSDTTEWTGRVSNFRITRGIPRYGSANFTPVSAAFDTTGHAANATPGYTRAENNKYVAAGAGYTTNPLRMELADLLSAHEGVTNPSRLTISSTYNGRYGRLYAQSQTANGTGQIKFIKNAGSAPGMPTADFATSGDETGTIISAPVPLATSDYFELQWLANGAFAAGTYQSEIEVLPTSFDGAMIYKSGSTVHTSNAQVTISFGSTAYDLHSPAWVSGNTLVVPSGVTLVRLHGGLENPGSSTSILYSLKNGSVHYGGWEAYFSVAGSFMSAPLAVTAGDIFSLGYFNTADITIPVSDYTYLAIEKLDPTLRYALVRQSSNGSIAGSTHDLTLAYDTEEVDTSGWHTPSPNPERLTVPAGSGITHVRCMANAIRNETAGSTFLGIRKNGALITHYSSLNAVASDRLWNCTGIVPVVEGDYFDVVIYQSGTTGTMLADTRNWFSIEEVPNFDNGTISGSYGLDWKILLANSYSFDWIIYDSYISNNYSFDWKLLLGNSYSYDWRIINSNLSFGNLSGVIGATPDFIVDAIFDLAESIQDPTLGVTSTPTPPDHVILDPVDGVNVWQFYGDFYERLWVDPVTMRLTNPSLNSDIGFYLWNAFSEDINLITTDLVDLTGVTLSYSMPNAFERYEIKELAFQITDSAPPSLDGQFEFTSDNGGFAIMYLIATIVDLLRFIPNEPVAETWIFNTVVNEMIDSHEQRMTLTPEPRVSTNFTVTLTDNDARLVAYAQLYSFLNRTFEFPFYQYKTNLDAAVTSGDDQIFFDPDTTDVREGDYLAFYNPEGTEFILAKVETLEVDGVTLLNPVSQDIPITWLVVPCVTMAFIQGAGLSMMATYGSMTVNGQTLQSRDLISSETATLTTYDSMNVLDIRPINASGAGESFATGMQVIDNGMSIGELYSAWLTPLALRTNEWLIEDRPTEMSFWRTFISETAGRRVPFLVPTWRDDLPLATVPALGDNTIVTTNQAYQNMHPFDPYTRIQIELTSGECHYRTVTEVNAVGNTLQLILNEAIGLDTGDNDIRMISLMQKVRLDSDEIPLQHYVHHSVISLSLRAVADAV